MTKLILKYRDRLESGGLIEVVVWELDAPLEPCVHRFKYRLYFGTPGISQIRYDNERGKGDHIHYGSDEQPYRFITLEQLLLDFQRDIEVVKK